MLLLIADIPLALLPILAALAHNYPKFHCVQIIRNSHAPIYFIFAIILDSFRILLEIAENAVKFIIEIARVF